MTRYGWNGLALDERRGPNKRSCPNEARRPPTTTAVRLLISISARPYLARLSRRGNWVACRQYMGNELALASSVCSSAIEREGCDRIGHRSMLRPTPGSWKMFGWGQDDGLPPQAGHLSDPGWHSFAVPCGCHGLFLSFDFFSFSAHRSGRWPHFTLPVPAADRCSLGTQASRT